jgi:ComF family protein
VRPAARGFAALLDLLLPPTCAGCDALVAEPGQLCAACFRGLDFITDPVCERCGRPFASSAEAGAPCVFCIRRPPPWGQARAAFRYDQAARDLILPLKHADRTEIAETLARHMQRAGRVLLERAEVLVPVPLHRWRLLHRRYNQAALLAAALARRVGRPCVPDALRRVRSTASLGPLSALRRDALMQGAIDVRPGRAGAVTGKRILLIDDVLTSGATARACTRALLDAGAVCIDVLVVSRVADSLSGGGDAEENDNKVGDADFEDS